MADTAAILRRLEDNLQRVIVGKPEIIRLALVPLLCRGHLLIEDVPGVGKTTLARALARSIHGEFRRVQFTPDLLPMDLTGSSIYSQKTNEFEFKPGPVFTNILLADEINRATPRTQSALLECMEEAQVTVDGVSRRLPAVFFVIATQNPVEHAGTFSLPETQLDRFMLRIRMGYPTAQDEVAIFDRQARSHPIEELEPVVDLEEIERLRSSVQSVHIDESVKAYAAHVVRSTRDDPEVQLGASPRGTLSLLRAGQALALLGNERFVTPDIIKRLAPAVLSHRVLVRPQAALRGIGGGSVVERILSQVEIPISADEPV